ncbi:Mobile element protein [Azospirillum argentinense]
MVNRLGEMRDRNFENQAYRASGLNLLVSAIILWNTRYLEAVFAELATQGHAVPPELMRCVAPLGWKHVGLTGDYVWGADRRWCTSATPAAEPAEVLLDPSPAANPATEPIRAPARIHDLLDEVRTTNRIVLVLFTHDRSTTERFGDHAVELSDGQLCGGRRVG